MPPPLGGRSLLLAGCLRLVSLAGRGAEGVTYSSMTQQTAVGEVIHALYQSTVPPRRALPGPSYALVFPVVSAVLHCPSITPLHDQALAVLALHVAPEQDIPRGESLTLMYHLLGIIPAYRSGVETQEHFTSACRTAHPCTHPRYSCRLGPACWRCSKHLHTFCMQSDHVASIALGSTPSISALLCVCILQGPCAAVAALLVFWCD